ncbi:Mate-domain-containing protein [Balamuthia mandrillaris]
MRGAKDGGVAEEEAEALQGGEDAALAEDVPFDEEEEEEERRGGASSASLRIASFDEEVEDEKRRGVGGFFLDRFRRWHDQSVAIQELCIVLKLAAPIAGSYLCTMFIQLVSLFFVGHLGPTELAAAALGTMYCNALGFSLIIGLLSALDTLCSQAFGAQSYHRVGLVLQRAIVILMLLCIPIAAVWFFAEELLLLAKQDPETSRLAAVYTKTMIPALPCYVLFESLKRYLMAQSIVLPTMLASILGIVVNFIGNYVLIRIFSVGFIGAPLALVLTYFTVTLALWLSVYCLSLHRKTWPGFQLSQCFQGWREMFLLGLPGIVMICAEWWGFEIHALLAGKIGTNALAAHALVLNTTALCYMVPLGISLATTVRVGNLVGDLNPTRASKCARLMIYLTASEASVVALCLFAARHVWGYVFSSDDDVVAITAKILPVVVCFLMFDGLNAVGGGILRGVGWQKLGAAVNLVAFYAIGLPAAFLLAFTLDFGVAGLWMALGLSAILSCLVFLSFIWLLDWKKVTVYGDLREKVATNGERKEEDDQEKRMMKMKQRTDVEEGEDVELLEFQRTDEEDEATGSEEETKIEQRDKRYRTKE